MSESTSRAAADTLTRPFHFPPMESQKRPADANASKAPVDTATSDANASTDDPLPDPPSPRHVAALEREARNKERLTAPARTIRRMDGAAYFRELYLAHCAACVQAGIPVPTPDAWVDTLDAYISERAQDGLQDDAGEPT